MNQKQKKKLIQIILSLFLGTISFLLKEDQMILKHVLFITAYLFVGYDVLIKAVKNIFRGKVMDENFLMSVATIGAFWIGEFEEAVAVMIFYQIGELFQSYAVDKSRKSIASLMDIRPDVANVYRNKKVIKVDPDDVDIGETILVKAGEKIALDGVLVEGESMLNTVALTGESVPRKVMVGDDVFSGCINQSGTLKIKVTKDFENSTVSKILDLVENASSRKSTSENFISKFARIYTPIVVSLAILLACIPPLLIKGITFHDSLYRALSFLVVSCPCALVISIPLSFFGGLGAASKMGVLIKGSNYLEALASTKIIVCDKTGTLTEGVFKVQKIESIGITKEELLFYVAHAEHFSLHPISYSIKEAYQKEIDESLITNTIEISGKGVIATINHKKVFVGNEKLMEENHIDFVKSKKVGTILYVAIDQVFRGTILISDQIKKDAYHAINEWRKNQVERIVMLTGDREDISKSVSNELKIDEYHAELLPQDKVSYVEEIRNKKLPTQKLLFIGDGINDAPVLALSDIGVAMGGLGSDAAIEAADVVIMTDEPSKVASAIKLSKRTMRIVTQNIVFAISVKILVLILSALGITSMWLAVFADVGVSLLAILNSLRMLSVKWNS